MGPGYEPWGLHIKPAQARQIARKFKPYTMPGPPTGSYDPSLDAARDAAHRGYGDLQQDTGLADSRAGVDYGLGVDQINRGYTRNIADLDQSLTRGGEDYNTNTGLLKRAFVQLGRQQTEGARHAGVLSGGIAALSAAKRTENQGIQQSALDTDWTRAQSDIATQRARLGEDKESDIGALGLGYERGLADRSTALTRAGREDRRFGLDTASQKSFQASQAGYVPPGRGEPGGMPANEHRDARGAFRVQTIGGRQAKVRPDGTVEYLKPRIMARRRGQGFGAGARSLY